MKPCHLLVLFFFCHMPRFCVSLVAEDLSLGKVLTALGLSKKGIIEARLAHMHITLGHRFLGASTGWHQCKFQMCSATELERKQTK
jgi:hypothetical protein